MTPEHKARAASKPIRLHFEDTTQVVVQPNEKDRFVKTVAEVTKACEIVDGMDDFRHEFDQLLAKVNAWSKEHASDVLRSYVVPKTHGLEAYIVTKGDSYRFDLDDEVSRLDLELVEKFPRFPVHVLHLPDESPDALQSFFSLDRALQVYGV